jgi:phospholipase/lecithinase/hemolysin
MKSIPLHGVRRFLAAFLVSLIIVSVSTAATAFSKIVVFGDSLNDRGNMAAFTGGAFPNAPAYVYGRQSNGPIWVEYLASRLGMAGHLDNYAVVGAMTAPAPGFPTGNVWSVSENGSTPIAGLEGTDVTTQVIDYLASSQGAADPAALHILQGGANDLPRVANPAVIVQNLVQSFIRLQQAGAKHIMVANLPDIGKTPRVILAEQFGILSPGTGKYLSAVCLQLNGALAGAIGAATFPGVTVAITDMHRFLNVLVVEPARYGLVNTSLPYLMFGAGADPATWLFWDDLQPTTRGHAILAEDAISSLIEAYSPRNGEGDGNGVINSLRGLARRP